MKTEPCTLKIDEAEQLKQNKNPAHLDVVRALQKTGENYLKNKQSLERVCTQIANGFKFLPLYLVGAVQPGEGGGEI